MSQTRKISKYIEFDINGKLFPSWILKNFSKYKLDEVLVLDGEDPCQPEQTLSYNNQEITETKLKMRKYQEFITKYLDYNSPYKDILLYHGLGSGKTGTAINIYNMLYNYTSGWNVFILIKAALRDQPWLADLEKWLDSDKSHKMSNIVFISYDSPIADTTFLEALKNADITKKNLYIFDEVHNFIRNVYSNINSGLGKRAQVIYDYIISDKKENEGVRVILLSGTPAINVPFELALLFNLLRPGTFPKSETAFNQLYISKYNNTKINETTKNMFQRRIMGLVSYYIGATPDLYASKQFHYINVPMSNYQASIYTYFEDLEEKLEKQAKAKGNKKASKTYKTYTRQASNFVFPAMGQRLTGELRTRPSQFRLNDTDDEKIGTNKLKLDINLKKLTNVQKYLIEINKFTDSFEEYLNIRQQKDISNNYTLLDDVTSFLEKYNGDYMKFHSSQDNKSSVYKALYESSSKMLYIIFMILISPGPVQVYSNYVLIEGLQIFKIYLNQFGFTKYTDRGNGTNNLRYTEFHGRIDTGERKANLISFNNIENKYGELIKIILISPAGAEGISLENTVQVHIMEPHWNEVRITQMIGRAIRQCSHKNLPMKERHVNIFRYKSVIPGREKITTDQSVENTAQGKESLIQSFLDTIKEAALDCELNRAHNMMEREYKCFQFDEPSLFTPSIGAAYRTDIQDDIKFNNGYNAMNSIVTNIKVMKIKAVIQISQTKNLINDLDNTDNSMNYSEPQYYWYNKDTNVIYDYDLHYAVGKLARSDVTGTDISPLKLDKDTYIIDKLIYIPVLVS